MSLTSVNRSDEIAGIDGNSKLRWLRFSFWGLAIVLGVLHAWAAGMSQSMNPDGIAYLDMGDAYLRGDFRIAINAYWSPLYSWILGVTTNVLKPPMRWEFPIVHIVNFFIYLMALGCFEFFWTQLMDYQSENTSDNRKVTLPDWAMRALGYSLFIWSSLSLIKIWAVTPDMCVAAFVFLAAGLIVSIRRGLALWRTFFLLGLVLGLGYLTKAAMFPLGFVFLLVSLFSVGNIRRAIPLTLVALVVFLLICGPLIIALSKAKGRPTFGDSGKLMYAWFVGGIPHAHWQGEGAKCGAPDHPTRKIFESPPIYEFGTPVGGTYPVSYDPSYWYEGAEPCFNFKGQLNVLVGNIQYYFDLFFRQQGGLIAGILILYLMMHFQPIRGSRIIQQWGLFFLGLFALTMYAMVHVQSRYIGAFILLLWGDLLVNLSLPDSKIFRRFASVVSAIMILFILMNIVAFNLEGFSKITGIGKRTHQDSKQARSPSWPGEVAEELHRLNIAPGDGVAVIGYAFDSYWARLARLKIVAEMFDWEADPFWLGKKSFQSQIIDVFKRTGAKAIVAENVPGYARLKNWHQVSDTNYYIYLLAP